MEKKFRLKFADGQVEIITLNELLGFYELATGREVMEAREKVGDAKNGEVYEGDKILGEKAGKPFEYKAALVGMIINDWGMTSINFEDKELVK